MKVAASEPNSAFDPHSSSSVSSNHLPLWYQVSKFMASPAGSDERGSSAAVQTSLPLVGEYKKLLSIEREEAEVLNNLKRRVGHCRVRNTSTYEVPCTADEKGFKNPEETVNSSPIDHYDDFNNQTLLLKMLMTRPLKRLSNINDTSTDWSTSEFISECLCWHNVYRQRHRAPPLTLNSELCILAQEWANTLAHMNIFFYRPYMKDVGQNIYCRLNVRESRDVTGQEVAGYWYATSRRYNFSKKSDVYANSGHFTQLIWASSRDIGLGFARSRSGKVMVVANYRPSGNIYGQFHKNVFPPVFEISSNIKKSKERFPDVN